jgi:hypothetical protein
VFPFFAIITAQYLFQLTSPKSLKAVRITQIVVAVLMMIVVGVLQYFFRPDALTILTGLIILLFILALAFIPQRLSTGMQQNIYRSLLASFVVNLFLNLCFYPSLLHYQGGSEAAIWLNQHNPGRLPVYTDAGQFHDDFNFYLQQPFTELTSDKVNMLSASAIIYTAPGTLKAYADKGLQVTLLHTFKTYPVTRLKPAFLNKYTRDTELGEMVLVIILAQEK